MHSSRKPASAGMISCSMILTVWAAIAPTVADGQTKPTVTVVNPVSNPVNTRITNGVVPVEVSNADPIPVALPESEGSRAIFSRTILVDFANTQSSCNFADELAVPAGKRMVVEYVSATFYAGGSQHIVVVTLLDKVSQRHLIYVPGTRIGVAAGGVSTFSGAGQYVHSYFDSALAACVQFNDSITGSIAVLATGYFVDKP